MGGSIGFGVGFVGRSVVGIVVAVGSFLAGCSLVVVLGWDILLLLLLGDTAAAGAVEDPSCSNLALTS